MFIKKIILSSMIISASFAPAAFAADTTTDSENSKTEVTADTPSDSGCGMMKSGHGRKGHGRFTEDNEQIREERHEAMLKIQEKELEFLKTLQGVDKAEAEKKIDEFYKTLFSELPHPPRRADVLIEQIEKMDIDPAAKDQVISRIKENMQPGNMQNRMQQRAVDFAKNLLTKTPEEQKEAIEKRNEMLKEHFDMMKNHKGGMGKMSKKGMCDMGGMGKMGMGDMNGMGKMGMGKMAMGKMGAGPQNVINAQELTINFNNCMFTSDKPGSFKDAPHHKGKGMKCDRPMDNMEKEGRMDHPRDHKRMHRNWDETTDN